MTELKRCPFCGGHDKYLPAPKMLSVPWAIDVWTVECDNCQATCGYESNEEDAKVRWNQRHSRNIIDKLIAEAESKS